MAGFGVGVEGGGFTSGTTIGFDGLISGVTFGLVSCITVGFSSGFFIG